ncbi:hypothetical protein EDD52_12366 [Primorskyibacter sedentarius]|uniref:Uncharacterized protein n=1 Tax=Primorskyibacter sedentarius TaxID=745311 RepID=A0A4R3J540_9RHOB|nr:hypothetical protein EDD52_12366 [Primorskyibacter sedentarius]
MTASKAQSENDLSAVDRTLKEGTISFTAFDSRVDCAGHLGSD